MIECPFCGSQMLTRVDSTLGTLDVDEDKVLVECDECGIRFPISEDDAEELELTLWHD